MKRLACVLLLVLAAAFATGCGSNTAPASINGEDIDRGEFLDHLSQISKLGGKDDTSVSSEDSSNLLTQTIIAALIADEVKRLGIAISDDEIASVRAAIAASLEERAEQGEATDAISDSFIDYAARVQVEQDALIARITDATKPWFNDGDIRSYYDLLKDKKYLNFCTHHILVADEAAANEILGLLKNGGDFAQLAKDRSTDTGSGAEGGDLGCTAKGGFVAEFEDAVLAARAGDTLGPVKSEFGYHVIRVDKEYGVQSFDSVREAIATTLAGQNGWLEWKVYSTKIDINKKYGTWSNESASVVPPADPTAK